MYLTDENITVTLENGDPLSEDQQNNVGIFGRVFPTIDYAPLAKKTNETPVIYVGNFNDVSIKVTLTSFYDIPPPPIPPFIRANPYNIRISVNTTVVPATNNKVYIVGKNGCMVVSGTYHQS